MSDEVDPSEFLVTLGLFRTLQAAPMGDLREVDSFYRAAEDEIGIPGLLRGWDLVATALLNQVKFHAEQLGCDCGSDEWLKELHLFYNAHGFSEGS